MTTHKFDAKERARWRGACLVVTGIAALLLLGVWATADARTLAPANARARTPVAAHAANVDCTTLTNPVYFPATTLLETLLSKVAPVLADPARGADQMTIVYFPLSSCLTYDIHKDQTDLTGTATYYLPDGTQMSCDMPVGTSIKSDLSAMDVGGVTCLGGQTPPADLKEYPSHVETLGFVVPRNSSQTAITATEAYYILKFGGESGRQVEPWTDPQFVMVRNPGSSTQLTIGANTGIPGTMWNSNLHGHQGSGDVRDDVIAQNTTGNAEKVLGILNSSKWEAATNDMKVLAFQPFNNCFGAVFPDSTATSRDKRNVRDGHYPIWTNLRYIVRVDGSDNVVTANGATAATRVQRFIDLMTGVASIPALNVSQFVIDTGNIPTCAMHVQREIDGGTVTSFSHPAPCDCYFLEQNGVSSGCTTCTDDAGCSGAEKCRNNYCEPR